jgi:DNA-binding LytR/AlgR family response regulator
MGKYGMMISGNRKSHLVYYKDIICIRAAGHYIEIIENNSITPYLISKSLINLEAQFPKVFFKCYSSAIMSITCIASFKYRKTLIIKLLTI